MRNHEDDKIAVLGILAGLFVVVLILVGVGQAIFGEKPVPKTVEQLRAERHERFHEAGASVHEFLRGAVGANQKTAKPEPKREGEPGDR